MHTNHLEWVLRPEAVCAGNATQASDGVELIIGDGLDARLASWLGEARVPVRLVRRSDSVREVLELITEWLLTERPRVLHLFAHGQPGMFKLADRWIDAAELERHADLLSQWQLDRLALWSCRAGAGGELPQSLERLTGCSVYSSCLPVGRFQGQLNDSLHRPGADTEGLSLRSIMSAGALSTMDFALAQVSVVFNVGFLGTQDTNVSSPVKWTT